MAQFYLYPVPTGSSRASFAAAITNQTLILVSTTAAAEPLVNYTGILPLPAPRKPDPETLHRIRGDGFM
jgi:hypothetical protein